MSKQKIGSDDLSLDKELDFPEFDFDFGEPPKDRTPAEEILDGAREGINRSYRNTGFIKRLIRASLPPVYGEVVDTVDNVSNNITSLYDSAVKEIKPGINEVARTSQRLIPERFKKSKSALEKIKDWSSQFSDLKNEDRQKIREDNITLNVADVFYKEKEKEEGQESVKDAIKDSLDLLKHKQNTAVFSSIATNVSRLSQYTEKITQAFQKKSLELQYRSLFAQTDTLDEIRKLFQLSESSYKSIVKNTALPEYVKLRDSERFKELIKTKTMESLFGTTQTFINKTFKNIGIKTKEYTELFKDGLAAASMGLEAAEMNRSMGDFDNTTFKEKLAAGGAEVAVQSAGLMAGSKIRKLLEKNKTVKGIVDNTQYGLNNLPELVTRYANSTEYGDSDLKNGFKNILRDLIGNQNPDASLQSDNSLSSSEYGFFSSRTNKSIIEIIPGYLSRILREIQVFRTGDESIDLTVYDPYKNSFTDKGSLKKAILEKLIPQSSIETHKSLGQDIMKLIDPEGKLSEEQRHLLYNKLTKDRFNRKLLDPENLTNERFFSKEESLKDFSKEIASVFESYFTAGGQYSSDSQEFRDKRNQLSELTSRIGRFMTNPTSEIQNLINSGYYDELRQLGLITETGSAVNTNEILDKFSVSRPTDPVNGPVQRTINKKLDLNNQPNQQNVSADIEKISQLLLDSSQTLKEFIGQNKVHQERFTSFISDNLEPLKNIELLSSKQETKVTNEILLRIEDFLINKLQTIIPNGQSTNGTNGFIDPERIGYYKDSLLNNLRGLYNRTVTPFYEKIVKPGTNISKNLLTGGLKLGFQTTNALKNKLFGLTNNIANIITKAKDIFVIGELEPRLTAAGLKAGKYKDSITGKIIQTIEDLKKIKGDIVDDEGNTVLKINEIKNTFVKKIEGTGILKIGQWLGNKALDLTRFSGRQFVSTSNFLLRKLTGAKKSILNIIDQPIDVYVKGVATPVLLAVIMRSGGYYSAATNKVINRPSEIDGPIKDNEGNYVLTADQIKLGLVDKDGNTLKTPLMKVFGYAGNLLKSTFTAGIKLAKFGTDLFKSGMNKTGDFLNGILDTLNTGLGGKKSLSVLEQIRDILDNRLPGGKSIHGDLDGDGDRDNSWRDIFSRNKENETTEKKEKHNSVVQTGRKNTFDKIGEMLSGVKDNIMDALGLGEDVTDNLPDGDKKRGRKSRRKGGLIRKTGRLVGRVGGAALGAGAFLGKGALAAGAAALPALASAAGTVATATGTILSGLAAILASPIILKAAAVAAVGYGAYKAYKYFTKKEYSTLTKLRMAQYGLSIDEADYVPRIMELETELIKHITYGDNANFKLEDAHLDRLMSIFGIDTTSTDAKTLTDIKKWTQWFTNRFKPVYLTHMTVLNNLQYKEDLNNVDKMDGKTKLKYINGIAFPQGNYGILVSPFPELKSLTTDSRMVQAYVGQAITEANEQISKESKDKKSEIKDSLNTNKVSELGQNAVTDGKIITKNVVQNTTFLDKLKQNVLNFGNLALNLNPFSVVNNLLIKVTGQSISEKLGFNLTALQSVRFKTYGFTKITRSKASILKSLEAEVLKDITIGSDKRAYYKKDIKILLSQFATDFAISDPNSERANDWLIWFQQRFLATYLNYVGLVSQELSTTKAVDSEARLKPSSKLDIAKKVAATLGVWVVTKDPFGEQTLNTDESVVKENIEYLVKSSKDEVLPEQSTVGEKIKQQTKAVTGFTDTVKPDTKIASSTASVQTNNKIDIQPQESPTDNIPSTQIYRDKNDVTALNSRNRYKAKSGFSGFGPEMDGYISEAAQKYGMDEKILRGFIKMEDGWTGKMSPTGAIGPGQFIQSTWDSLAKTEEGKAIGMTKIGDRFRTPQDPRHDKRINTLATALLAKQNADMLKKNNLEVTGENLYMMHNIGPGFIQAIKTGQASPATLKAMQQNGMKPGMTPASFVQYQQKKFNNHYSSANSSSSEQIQIAQADVAPTIKAGIADNRKQVISGYVEKTERPSNSSYAGSVEKTKPNPQIAPTITARPNIVEQPDDFSSIMRDNRNVRVAPRADRQKLDPTIVASSILNNGISSMEKSLRTSVDLQTKMLDKLQEISENTKSMAIKQTMPLEEKPKATEPTIKTTRPSSGDYIKASTDNRVSKVPVNMSRI